MIFFLTFVYFLASIKSVINHDDYETAVEQKFHNFDDPFQISLAEADARFAFGFETQMPENIGYYEVAQHSTYLDENNERQDDIVYFDLTPCREENFDVDNFNVYGFDNLHCIEEADRQGPNYYI